MILGRGLEELLQILLRRGSIARLELVEAGLRQGGVRGGRVGVLRAHFLQRGHHGLRALFLAGKGLGSGLRGALSGDWPRLQLEHLGQGRPGLALPRVAPGREAPHQHDGHYRGDDTQQERLLVRDHPVHGLAGPDLELVGSLQLLAVQLFCHRESLRENGCSCRKPLVKSIVVRCRR